MISIVSQLGCLRVNQCNCCMPSYMDACKKVMLLRPKFNGLGHVNHQSTIHLSDDTITRQTTIRTPNHQCNMIKYTVTIAQNFDRVEV